MAFRLRQTVLACALAAGSIAAGPALAHEAGDILLKVGVTHVEPKSDNGTVANGTVNLDIDGSTRPSFTLTYMATRNIGIELLAAAQGCDFHAPLRSSTALESVRATLRAQVPTLEEDRYFHPDMVTATNLVRSGALAQGLAHLLPGVELPTVEPQA